MFGRRRSAPTVQVRPQPAPSAKGMWRDALGTLATRSIQIIAVAVLLVAIVIGLRQLTVVVIPVILAIVFAAAFEPLMRWLRARMPSVLATIIVLLGIVVVIGGVGWAIVRAVISQWPDLYASATDGVDKILAWLNGLPVAQQWLGDDPDTHSLTLNFDEIWTTVQDLLSSSGVGASIGSGAVAGVSAVATFITGLVLMVVVLFFFLKDGPVIWGFLLRPFQGEWYGRMQRAGTKTVDTLGSYVRGTAGVAAADAIGIGIGLFALGIPLALPLTLLVFILAFIPIVGATLAGVFAALLALVDGGFLNNGLLAAVIVVGIVVLVNQLEGNFLQPVLMGRALKLHSLVILVALTIGTVTAGILGAILAVPITAVAWGIVKVWDGEDTPATWARPKP